MGLAVLIIVKVIVFREVRDYFGHRFVCRLDEVNRVAHWVSLPSLHEILHLEDLEAEQLIEVDIELGKQARCVGV